MFGSLFFGPGSMWDRYGIDLRSVRDDFDNAYGTIRHFQKVDPAEDWNDLSSERFEWADEYPGRCGSHRGLLSR